MKQLFVLLVFFLFSASAAASDDKRFAEADALFKRGTEAFEAGRFEEALKAHQRAWELSPTFRTAVGAGQVELHLGLHREAATHLSYALAHFPPDGDAELRQRIEAGLDEATTHVGAIRITVDVSGVTVRVDGEPVGVAPLADRVFVEPGEHSVSIEGAQDARGRATVDAVVRSTVDVSLSAGEELAASGAEGPSPAAWALIAGGTLTAGALVVSAVFSANASAAQDDLDRARERVGVDACGSMPGSDCRIIAQATADRDSDSNAATIAAVTAGALGAATAVVAAVLWPLGKESPSEVGFEAGPTGAKVRVFGRF